MTDRLTLIQTRLQEALSPTQLEVIDESDQHIGHAGHQGGGRHFAVIIAAECLNGLSRVEAHRRIYDLFSDLMPHDIHALRIKIILTK
jgi:BolA protein